MPERVEAPLGANINTWTKAARDAKQKHKAAVHGHGMYHRLLACGVWAIREERDSWYSWLQRVQALKLQGGSAPGICGRPLGIPGVWPWA